jgi:O-methyltransferase
MLKYKSITWKGRLSKIFNKFVGKKIGAVICSTKVADNNPERSDYIFNNDFIRHASLELAAREINENNIKGSAAEVGVFRGDFAACINAAFPNKKLYLFDTFEGFDKKDIKIEIKNNYAKKLHDFSKTNIETVLQKMKFRENCVIKKGYFPDSAKGLEDSFVFVSLDADLYEPIYNGLVYFYPRLVRGGYIFVHDYNGKDAYDGVKIAVKKYCKANNIAYFPLSDNCGSAVIMK